MMIEKYQLMSSNKTELFDYLLIGLKEYLNRDKKYPYPDLLRHGMNALSLQMKKSIPFPKTINGFLQFVSEPVNDWCPEDWIPKQFDGDFGLIDEESLSEEANDYYFEKFKEKNNISEFASTKIKQLEIDNSKFTSIFKKLQDVYDNDDSQKAQEEYNIFRPFLIHNQYTIPGYLRKTFRRSKYISLEEIGELYEECESNQTYWICDRCGILTEKYRRLKGLKPSLCGNHSKDKSYVHQVKWEKGLLRIKDGIHQRVCFPGIPELNLYSALETLQEEYPDYLKEVRLYPSVDRYDIQLRFCDDSIWAIDYKDVRNPYRLAKNLKPLYGEGSLHYNESFYVISDRCIENHSDYVKITRQEAKTLPYETQVVSDKFFRTQVNNKITELQKGGTN